MQVGTYLTYLASGLVGKGYLPGVRSSLESAGLFQEDLQNGIITWWT